MFEQKFAFSIVFLCSHAVVSLWFFTVFSIFCIEFFNDFPNPFIVPSRPSFFYEPNFRFSVRVFVHMRHFDIDFLFFFFKFFILFF